MSKNHSKKVCGCFPKFPSKKEDANKNEKIEEIMIHPMNHHMGVSSTSSSSDAEETSSSQSQNNEGIVLFLKKYAENNHKKLYSLALRNNANVVGLYHGPFRGTTLESCIYTWPAQNENQLKEIFERQNIDIYYIFKI